MPNNKSSVEMYNVMVERDQELRKEIYSNIPTLVRSGNEHLSAYLIEKILKEEVDQLVHYGYSKEHLECLNRKRTEIQFKKSSILKQNYTANFCSPIHCAVINSNTEMLTYILKHISGEFNVGDSMNRKPIHLAATLDQSKTL